MSYFQSNGDFLTHIAVSAKWKYKAVAIILAILMVYLLFAAVECAIQAAKQGGVAYQIMWFSILVTYGGEPKAILRWAQFLGSEVYLAQSTPWLVSWPLTLGTCSPVLYLTCCYLQLISTFSTCT